MLATFCWRLACGLACALLVLDPRQVNPRFYRVHFLTILGLTVFWACQLPALRVEIDPDANLPQDHPYIRLKRG